MTGKIKKYILLVIIVFALAGLVIVYKTWNKPHQNIENAVAIKITAAALYNGFANNNAKTQPNFINKVIAVEGEVREVLRNEQHQQVILLKTSIAGGSVNCTMEKNANNIKPGSIVLIKGICSGFINGDSAMNLPGDVFLIRCYPSE